MGCPTDEDREDTRPARDVRYDACFSALHGCFLLHVSWRAHSARHCARRRSESVPRWGQRGRGRHAGSGNAPSCPCAARSTYRHPLWRGERDAHTLGDAVLKPLQHLARGACHPTALCVQHDVACLDGRGASVPHRVVAPGEPSRGSIFHALERPEASGVGLGQEPRPLVVDLLRICRDAQGGRDGHDRLFVLAHTA
jgi:hypothetical protein